MTTKYTLHFTDTSKTPFDLQSYTTNGPESPSDPSIIAGATTAATTLKLWGKGLPEYGEPIFQDLVYMLEHFANSSAPVFPIEGQMWYNNSTAGSPSPLPKLLAYDGSSWGAVILANGASAMTEELILSGNLTVSSNINAAAPKQYVDSTTAPAVHTHPTSDINDISATAIEIDYLVAATSNIQAQLDDKISRSIDEAMDLNVDLTFNGGEVLGLPNVPSGFSAATSMTYVDDQIAFAIASSGDGVLTSASWENTGLGTPLPDPSETTLRLTITNPGIGSPPSTTDIDVLGISRYGHIHLATEVSIDNAFDVTYGTNTQTAIERAAAEIELLKTGGVAPTATITVQRIFEALSTPLTVAGSPIDTFTTQNHTADDNRVTVSINGVKQYAHARASQSINYSDAIDATTATGLDSGTTYEFNISADGGPTTTVVVNPAGSPTIDISTHAALVTAINTALAGVAVAATFSIDSLLSEVFTSNTSGSSSAISITDPGGSPNVYLFAGGSPLGLDLFTSVGTPIAGVTGDYMETDSLGVQVLPSALTSYIVFNYDIITGSKIESLLYV